MTRFRMRSVWWMLVVLVLAAGACGIGLAQGEPAGAGPVGTGEGGGPGSMLDFVRAGGIVGYAIIALSAAGVALVIDSFVRIKPDKLMPASVVQQADKLARAGKFSELTNLCQASDSMVSQIFGSGLAQAQLGLFAVREAMQERGTKEVTRLQQRVGYVGFIASVAPMLGLLGTVTGMIGSFNVLGVAKGAARPDQLAVGISEALVTTCMGLIVAVPLMFFHNYFRDRVTRISQDVAGMCDRLLRVMTAVVEMRTRTQAAGGQQAAMGFEPGREGQVSRGE